MVGVGFGVNMQVKWSMCGKNAKRLIDILEEYIEDQYDESSGNGIAGRGCELGGGEIGGL